MASDTFRLSFCSRFCIAEDSLNAQGAVAGAAADEEEDEFSGAASDLSWVRIRTCSTMSSSVLARLDQHSSAAAMVIEGGNGG